MLSDTLELRANMTTSDIQVCFQSI